MKEPRVLPIAEAIAQLDAFDDILDARSPSEYAEDHLPRAISTPVLDDDERITVGTLHKHDAFEARRRGAATVARNIASLIEGALADRGRDWTALAYCWRGGNRSGALATILARVGWRISVVSGGYREYRRFVLADIDRRSRDLRFLVVAGRTGSGKSRLLQRAARLGAQVLDLEAIARHRGSVLGGLPGSPQPTQKHFDTLLWDAMRRLDPARPVLVESESRKVGNCQLSEALIGSIRASECVRIEASPEVRSRLLLDEYVHFVENPGALIERLETLLPMHGHQILEQWRALIGSGEWPALVGALLERHYDPSYDRSMRRNFARLEASRPVELQGADDESLELAARELARMADA